MAKLGGTFQSVSMKRRFWKFIVKTQEGEKTLIFPSYEDFYKILTPHRMEILSFLARFRVKSINELAEKLGRDYKNVLKDLRVLESAGFIRLKPYLNRKIPKLIAKGVSFNVDLIDGFPVRSESKVVTDEKLLNKQRS